MSCYPLAVATGFSVCHEGGLVRHAAEMLDEFCSERLRKPVGKVLT